MIETKNKKKVLIISHDKIGSSMAGPGIRYHYMAEVLSDSFDVTVGFYDKSYLPEKSFKKSYKAKHVDAYYFESGFENIDIVITHWLTRPMIKFCTDNNIFTVFDLYVPGPVENLASVIFGGKNVKPEDDAGYDHSLDMYHVFFDYGDLFLFSNRRQLDYWTGYAFGSRTVHLATYEDRPLYDRFIYAPMGIDTKTTLKHAKKVMRGVIPEINDSDKILVWTGGIWGHFDGKVLIQAMAKLADKRPDIKLVFFGTQHPNPNVPEMKESLDTREVAKQLGLLNKNVFFKNGWVKYDERTDYLLEADVAINTHKNSIETEFSHRTRVLDHLLAELPTISTGGDYLSDEVIEPLELGVIVPPNDEDAIVKAIVEILEPKNYNRIKSNVTKSRTEFDWNMTLNDLKNILLASPTKLEVLKSARRLEKPSSALRLARKVTPVPVKKLVVRAMRVTGLK